MIICDICGKALASGGEIKLTPYEGGKIIPMSFVLCPKCLRTESDELRRKVANVRNGVLGSAVEESR
jgi:C4-type Zn-finger protein